MYQEFFQKSPLLGLPLAALVIFLVAFAVMVLRAVTRSAGEIEGLARIPLDDPHDDKEARR